MRLLDHLVIVEICNRAIDTGLALPPRDALFLGIGPAVRAAIVSTASDQTDGLRMEIDRLNTFIYPTDRDGYLLAIWLINAANRLQPTRPSDATIFRQWADTVAAIPAPPPVTSSTMPTGIGSAAKAEGLTNQKVSESAQSLRAAMPSMNRRATNLMVAKGMHDALHQIQLHVVPLWSRALAALASSPGLARDMAADCQRQLGDKSRALEGVFGFLQQCEELRTEAKRIADDLVTAAVAADAALAADDTDAMKASIANVRSIVKDGMSVFANRMDRYQEGLDLSDILVDIAGLAEASNDATLRADASRLASSLAAIIQDINVLGPQHSRWQLLDARLGSLENWFDYLYLGPAVYSSFNLDWSSVKGTIDSLAGDPPTDRFDRVKTLRDDFLAAFPVPAQAAPSDQAIRKFGDFVIQVRSVFYGVDLRMKQICNQLREITNQLAQL